MVYNCNSPELQTNLSNLILAWKLNAWCTEICVVLLCKHFSIKCQVQASGKLQPAYSSFTAPHHPSLFLQIGTIHINLPLKKLLPLLFFFFFCQTTPSNSFNSHALTQRDLYALKHIDDCYGPCTV